MKKLEGKFRAEKGPKEAGGLTHLGVEGPASWRRRPLSQTAKSQQDAVGPLVLQVCILSITCNLVRSRFFDSNCGTVAVTPDGVSF